MEMRKLIYANIIIIFCFFNKCYPLVQIDSSVINCDTLHSNCTLMKIEKDQIDSMYLCNSDSLVLGRYTPHSLPIILDFQFYLPYEDTLLINLYDKEGKPLCELFNKYLEEGYYSFRFSDKLTSGLYFISLKTRKQMIIERFIFLK